MANKLKSDPRNRPAGKFEARSEHLHVRITKSAKKGLMKYAKEQGVSASDVVHDFIENLIWETQNDCKRK